MDIQSIAKQRAPQEPSRLDKSFVRSQGYNICSIHESSRPTLKHENFESFQKLYLLMLTGLPPGMSLMAHGSVRNSFPMPETEDATSAFGQMCKRLSPVILEIWPQAEGGCTGHWLWGPTLEPSRERLPQGHKMVK